MKWVSDAPPLPVLRYVSEDFDQRDPVRVACVNIIMFVAKNESNKLRRLTFGMLRDAAELDAEGGKILHRAIAYLTGARARFLEIGYEYVPDPDGDYEHELDPEEVEAFLRQEEFYDPRTGLLVKNCVDYIYIFFRPNFSKLH